MSIGFFLERNAAVVWRGPMLHKAIQQFLEDVAWDELDYLLLDLPPGTGDVSMTLAQLLPQARVVVVTTPQPAAQSVARRAADMAAKVDLELLGVIENMSGFTTPDGQRFTIFGEGGGQLLADELDVPLLGKVPLSEELREHADTGTPLVLDRARRSRLAGDPPGGARDHRRDARRSCPVMQAEIAGRARARADRRHRAPGRPGPELAAAWTRASSSTAAGGTSVCRSTSRSDFYDVERFRAGGSTLRPFELERGRRRRRQATRPPPVPLRARHALLGRAAAPRWSGSTSPRPRSRPPTRSPPRPALDARFVQADVYDAVDGARRRAVRRRLHRASERSTGFPTCRAGPGWSPSCSAAAAFSTWPSSTRSPGSSPTRT